MHQSMKQLFAAAFTNVSLGFIAAAIAMSTAHAQTAPESASAAPIQNATVTVDFDKSRGALFRTERYNNLTRAHRWVEQRDADVQFYNDQGLHGHTYRVWVIAEDIRDAKTGQYNFDVVEDYLADVSRLSDELLIVMDTRLSIATDRKTPAEIKPVIKTIMLELKQRFPQIKYVEAFNEPDHNLGAALKPEGLYDYYRVYYEAVNEINAQLKPSVPLQVGGPAFMMYNQVWMRAFLDSYKADTAPDKKLDFISYHGYGLFPEGDGNSQGPRAFHFYKTDPSEVANQRQRLEDELRSRGLDESIPTFVTELGIYPGPSFDNPKDPHPDYLTQAAGVPSLLYWFIEQPRTVPFNWVLRHVKEERKDQLITRAGEGKPIPTGIFTPYGNAMLMMSKLKDERVTVQSSALSKGKGVYAIATKDKTGAAIMLWNYQHIDKQAYRVSIDTRDLPSDLRGKSVRVRMFRIDDKISNYWGDVSRANLQQISEEVVKSNQRYNTTVELTPNALQLVILESLEIKQNKR